MINGVLNVLKPPGMTSHDVVACLRRLLRQKKIGHTGTLDPEASGVLPVCLGQATRIVEYITDYTKKYRAEVTFGIETSTYDVEGEITRRNQTTSVNQEELHRVLQEFVGKIEQVPPMTSAIKVNGKKLYELARQGLEVPRPVRQVTIEEIGLIDYMPSKDHPICLIDVICSKGTYIRTLCYDIGRRLGCGAYMSGLIRTAVGRFKIQDSYTLEEVEQAVQAGTVQDIIWTPGQALSGLSAMTVSHEQVEKLQYGQSLPLDKPTTEKVLVVFSEDKQLVAICAIGNGGTLLKPTKVFYSGSQ